MRAAIEEFFIEIEKMDEKALMEARETYIRMCDISKDKIEYYSQCVEDWSKKANNPRNTPKEKGQATLRKITNQTELVMEKMDYERYMLWIVAIDNRLKEVRK